jgi:hypothetical protein
MPVVQLVTPTAPVPATSTLNGTGTAGGAVCANAVTCIPTRKANHAPDRMIFIVLFLRN